MKIALTYDLRREYMEMGYSEEETAEFDSEETVEHLKAAVRELGHEAVPAGNIYELTRRLAGGETWDLVFNICEGLRGRNRESQAPALLEAYNIPYTFSDPLTLSLCLDKAMAKRVVRDSGVPTPDFFVINSVPEIDKSELPKGMKFPLFVKPVSEGTGKGVTPASIVNDPKELKNQARRLLLKYSQPVLVEGYLPGDEFTVGILGTGPEARVIGALEVKLLKSAEPLVYSYMNKELCEERVEYTLVKSKKLLREASDVALRAYQALQCRDAGRADLKAGPDGRLQFIEMNPLAGLHPTHSDLPVLCSRAGMSYRELVSSIIESASKRKASSNSRTACNTDQSLFRRPPPGRPAGL